MKVDIRNFIPAQQTKPATAGDIDKTVEAKKLRLKKATREFESFFYLHVLKAMRSTIPKSGLLEEGLGGDVYNSMFDMELSKKMAGGSSQSLADVLYRSLERHVVGSDGDNTPKIQTEIDFKSRNFLRSISPDKQYDYKSAEPNAAIETPQMPFAGSRPAIKSDPILHEFGSVIEAVSRKYELNPKLVFSVIKVESNGNPEAISSKGAKGLMQLTDGTATEMGVIDSLDPRQNIEGGARYLRQLLNKYDGDLRLTLAAYNAGPGAVSKYNGVPPYSETKRYIEKVLERLYNPK